MSTELLAPRFFAKHANPLPPICDFLLPREGFRQPLWTLDVGERAKPAVPLKFISTDL
jgi:hypothetical protein